jgi:hypothetical protein
VCFFFDYVTTQNLHHWKEMFDALPELVKRTILEALAKKWNPNTKRESCKLRTIPRVAATCRVWHRTVRTWVVENNNHSYDRACPLSSDRHSWFHDCVTVTLDDVLNKACFWCFNAITQRPDNATKRHELIASLSGRVVLANIIRHPMASDADKAYFLAQFFVVTPAHRQWTFGVCTEVLLGAIGANLFQTTQKWLEITHRVYERNPTLTLSLTWSQFVLYVVRRAIQNDSNRAFDVLAILDSLSMTLLEPMRGELICYAVAHRAHRVMESMKKWHWLDLRCVDLEKFKSALEISIVPPPVPSDDDETKEKLALQWVVDVVDGYFERQTNALPGSFYCWYYNTFQFQRHDLRAPPPTDDVTAGAKRPANTQ